MTCSKASIFDFLLDTPPQDEHKYYLCPSCREDCCETDDDLKVWRVDLHLLGWHMKGFVGVIGWGNYLRTYGIWFLTVWCGLFGWKQIGDLLRLKGNCLLSARVLFLIGLGARILQIVLLLWSFLLPLVLPLKLLFISLLFFVAVSCVHHQEHLVFDVFAFSSWLICFLLLIKKKQKKKSCLEVWLPWLREELIELMHTKGYIRHCQCQIQQFTN